MSLPNCEVCGSSDIKEEHSKIGTIAECCGCGSSFDLYYRRDGKLFDYPASWGRCVGVYCAQEVLEEYRAQEALKNPRRGAQYIFCSEDYYVFVDLLFVGRLRRRRMRKSPK
jgi:hypothetical protein